MVLVGKRSGRRRDDGQAGGAGAALLRIDTLLDLGDFRPQLATLYRRIGRRSIDPEWLIRMLLIGYLYGIRSGTRLYEEVYLNLADRWVMRGDERAGAAD